jgi:hypothetical protein
MKKYAIAFIIGLMSYGCQNGANCDFDQEIIESNDSTIAAFKSDTFLYDTIWRNHLKLLNEPFLDEAKEESYRLIVHDLMWESFLVYRIFEDSDSYKMIYKKYGGEQIERSESQLTANKEVELSKYEWDEFKELMDKNNFWVIPVKPIESAGLDGVTWILEAKVLNHNNCTNRDYHLVARWSPDDSLKVMELNRKLIELSTN